MNLKLQKLKFTQQSLYTQSPSQISPLVESPYFPESPLQRLCKDASNASRLVSEGNLPGYRLTAADDKLFGIYEDWLHQNFVTRLWGGVKNYDKWQQSWKKIISPTQHYDVPSGRVGKWFVAALAVVLGGIRNQQWNVESVIIFRWLFCSSSS